MSSSWVLASSFASVSSIDFPFSLSLFLKSQFSLFSLSFIFLLLLFPS
jgi:hypothetical protein